MTETTQADVMRASPFRRRTFDAREEFTYIGKDDFGGKALGLAFIQSILAEKFDPSEFPGITVSIPRMTVLRTSVFDAFMQRNNLYETALSDLPDERIARIFQRAEFPAECTGDLMTLVERIDKPLAVRSSSLLEDAMFQPFAGVYATKMIPNHHHDPSFRFGKLIEAIKFVYASTFFREAKAYIRRAEEKVEHEKMAVIIQEVVGEKRHNRFYPTISGVGRSYNYYPTGRAKPEQGVVNLALGLGKTIVDGGVVWNYSPAWPKVAPPVGSVHELLHTTQTRFWAVNLGDLEVFDPIRETEFMVHPELDAAEYDNMLKFVASTYDPSSDRLFPGVGREGPRAITFSPILEHGLVPLNAVLKRLLKICEEAVGEEVEIEFAATLDRKNGTPACLGFLQVRPMVVFTDQVTIENNLFSSPELLASSEAALGNGVIDDIQDVVYVRPDTFDAKYTPLIASELETVNQRLLDTKRPYLLIGFGRWGSSDPWLGTPVVWSQISGARVIVEAATPEMDVDLSQGSHFFHNLSAFRVCYLSVHHAGRHRIDWDWLEKQNREWETEHIAHVRLDKPLTVKVDGRTSKGIVLHG